MALCRSRLQAIQFCHTALFLATSWQGLQAFLVQTLETAKLKRSFSRSTSRSSLLRPRFLKMDLPYLRWLGLDICEADGSNDASAPSEESLEGWRKMQEDLRAQVKDVDDGWIHDKEPCKIGGLDISFENGTNRATAVLVVCELKGSSLRQVYEDAVDVDMDLPYISGFLFVREVPAYELLLRRLRESAPGLEPDLFLVDGSGVFHPRGCGSASHFGVLHGLRTVGVAKKLLCFDDFDKAAGEQIEQQILPHFGDSIPLVGSSGRVYGLALRTAHGGKKEDASTSSSKRIYLSVGHRISLETAKKVVLRCCDVGGSYIPEPVRLADLTGRAIERAWKEMQRHDGWEASKSESLRQMVMDISNLLDNKQRKNLSGMFEEANLDHEQLQNVLVEQLKRKESTIRDFVLPLKENLGKFGLGTRIMRQLNECNVR